MGWFRKDPAPEQERDINPYTLDQYLQDYFTYDGSSYPIFTMSNAGDEPESGGSGFEGIVNAAYRTNGIVFACMMARSMVFSDVRFTFREIRRNVPGDIASPIDGRNPASAGLSLLRQPWVGGTTGDLLARMISDVDIAGNAFVVRRGNQLVRLRPDWVSIVASAPEGASLWHPDAEVAGYVYKPGGSATDDEPISFLREEVAHFAPTPDPSARFRGVSWIEPILNEVIADKLATTHKRSFFENGATVNLMLEYPQDMKRDMFEFAVKEFGNKHQGAANAYRVLHLLGATAKPVGADMQQVDFKNVQAAGETRIAMAAGVPAAILGNSEGLQGSSLNTGNFSAARRLFGDRTIRPLWRNVCGSLANIIPAPPQAELWYDDTDVAFIREDQRDAAEIRQMDASTLSTLVTAGFDPDAALAAVTSGDFRRLKHTGLVSVQLLPPGQSSAPTLAPAVGENAKWAMRDALRGIVSDTIKTEFRKLPEPPPALPDERMTAIQLTLDYILAEQRRGPSQVNVTTPDVRVEPRIDVNVPEREVVIHPPDVNVTTPEQHIEVHVPEREVTVAPAEVNVTTPEVTVNVPEQRAPEVNVAPAEVNVSVEPTPITVAVPEQRAPDVTVNVPEQAPPTVNVQSPDVTVNVPEAPVPSVEVHVPETKVEVNVPRTKKTRRKIERDDQGIISAVVEEDVDD